MATCWEKAAHSVDHMFSFYFTILIITRFGFEGLIRVLFASVPDLCSTCYFFNLKGNRQGNGKNVLQSGIYWCLKAQIWLFIIQCRSIYICFVLLLVEQTLTKNY